MRTAIYPGTFDPITNGHLDLINRATKLFDKIIVAVAKNENKKPLMTLEERVELAKIDLKQHPTVEVIGFNGLLVETAKKHKAKVQIRGLRVITDFEYEFQMASMNRVLGSELESIYIFPSSKNSFISSSLIKEIVIHGGDVSKFITANTNKALNKKLN